MNVFDRYCKRYDAWYDKNRFAYVSELQALEKVMPDSGNGLEVGVGTGRFALPLGIPVGLDPSQEMLKIAAARGVQTYQGVGEHMPFASGSFDYVVSIISLCFVDDHVKVLNESRRVLKEEGKIIIGIIDKESFLGVFYQKKKSIFYRKVHFFSVRELSRALGREGFARIKYSQTLFDVPHNIHAVQKARKGFGEGGFVVIVAQKSSNETYSG